MSRHRPTLFIAATALATIGFTACSDEAREGLENEIGTAASEVEDAARTAASEVEDAARTAASEVEDAARTAASEVEDAAGGAASDVVEVAVRNIATQQGEEQFDDAGHPLDEDGLTCESTVSDGLDKVDVNCTGMTEEGETAELIGSTAEMPGASVSELEGTFTGSVDGTEVFSATNLGG